MKSKFKNLNSNIIKCSKCSRLVKFRNKIVTTLNKSNFLKDIFFNFADKGFKF